MMQKGPNRIGGVMVSVLASNVVDQIKSNQKFYLKSVHLQTVQTVGSRSDRVKLKPKTIKLVFVASPQIRVIPKLPNSEQYYKGKIKTH
jgi:hypothetical protein